MIYSINEISKLTGVNSSAIRYYEEQGILPPLERDSSNKRTFSEEDLELINFIKCLKNMGIPLKTIKENIKTLLNENKLDNTNKILLEHKKNIQEQINLLESYVTEIDYKLNNSKN